MRRFLRFFLPLLLAAVPVLSAQVEYRPWLEEVLLRPSAEIAVGRLVAQSTLPSRDRLLTFAISRKLKGEVADRVLVVGAGREILAYAELPKLLFLDRKGERYFQSVIDFVDLPEEGGRDRVDFLARYLELLGSDESLALERRMKRFVFEHLPATNVWIRRIVVREIRALAAARPGVFEARDLLVLREVDAAALPELEQDILREALQLVEEGQALGWTRGRLVFPDEETSRAFLRDLAVFEAGGEAAPRIAFLDEAVRVLGRRFAPYLARVLGDGSAELRRHAAAILGEMESAAGLARLEEMALATDDLEDRRAAVVALGKIAPLRSVPVLVRCLETVALQREALVALVAINTAEAALAVKDFDERLRKLPGADPELRRFLSRIRSDEFQKTLAAEREARRRRWEP